MKTTMTVRPAPTATSCSICGNDCAKECAITQDNDVICYPCAARAELAAFDADPARYSGYIANNAKWPDARPNHRTPRYTCIFLDPPMLGGFSATVDTWTGEPIAIVTECKATRRRVSEWVGECIYSVKVRNPRTGATYRGLTYGPGMYVSLTRTGAKK